MRAMLLILALMAGCGPAEEATSTMPSDPGATDVVLPPGVVDLYLLTYSAVLCYSTTIPPQAANVTAQGDGTFATCTWVCAEVDGITYPALVLTFGRQPNSPWTVTGFSGDPAVCP